MINLLKQLRVLKILICCLVILILVKETVGQKLLHDPELLHGKLQNGLSYYIKPYNKPEKIVELRLIVNVGSLSEEDSEQGFAHFVEHMCFNGTKNFPNNEVINYLESKGMRFGKHFNAYTSFAETVYQLSIPVSEDSALLSTGFQILEDWAHQVTFDDREIEKERGVILQELRTGQGAEQRLRNQYYPALFRGARYQYRLPIGKKEILETFSPDELRNFYKKWYRPELMSVIVVGDTDPHYTEKMVHKYFGNIEASSSRKMPQVYPVSDNDSSLFVICTDNEATKELVRIYFLDEPKNILTLADFRESIIEELIKGMINRRFQEINQGSDSPFIYSMASIGDLVRTKDAFTYTANAKNGMSIQAIKRLFTENRRLELHGLTKSELELEKKFLINQYKDKENEKTESKKIVKQLVNDILREKQVFDPSEINQLAIKTIPEISIAEVNNVLSTWISKKPIITLSLPDSMLTPDLEVGKLVNTYQEIKRSSPEKYVGKQINTDLKVAIKDEGEIINIKKNKKYGVTEWYLSNGAKIVLMPTNYKNDEILFTGLSLGGYSQYADKDFISALLAFRVAYMGGIADLSFTEIRNISKMNKVRLTPWMNEFMEGTKGSCNTNSLEFLLKLNYLYFNKLVADSVSAESYISRFGGQLTSIKNEPEQALVDTLLKVLYGSDSRKLKKSDPEEFSKFNVTRANQIIKERFADPSDFTFIIIGNFDLDTIRPLIKKYIGGLKGYETNDKIIKQKYFKINSSKEITLYAGETQKSQVQICYYGKLPSDLKSRSTATILTEILKVKLRNALREEKSGIYGISVGSSFDDIPENYFRFDIGFGCSTGAVDTLTAEVNRQIALIKENGPDKESMEKIKTVLTREFESNTKKNRFWQQVLTDIYRLNRNIDIEIGEYLNCISNVSQEQVQKMAIENLNDNKKVTIKMYPKRLAQSPD